MIQLLSLNNDRPFETEEELKKAYCDFKDRLESKKNLLQVCSDEELILDTLIQYNKDYELKESSEIRWEIDRINLQSEPLYTTTIEELEHFKKALEKNLNKPIKQIIQSMLDMANK